MKCQIKQNKMRVMGETLNLPGKKYIVTAIRIMDEQNKNLRNIHDT